MQLNKLQRLRQAAGLSQSQLAEAAGINVGTLRHYEQGSRQFDHAELGTILKACIVLNCRIDDIIEDESIKESWIKYNRLNKNKTRGTV